MTSDDLVERVAIAIDNAICDGDQLSVAMELTSEEIKVLSRAAIAVCMEEAAKIVDRNAEACVGNIMLHDILVGNAAAIRAMIKEPLEASDE